MINSISGQTAADAVQLLGGTQAATGGGQSATPVMSNVANLLGMSTSDLMSSLQSGSSLSDLATQKGVSRDDLLAAITQGLQAGAPGQSSDVSTLAAQIADQKGMPGHHHHGHHHGGASTSTDLQQNVADLASSLGISSDELVAALQSGLAGTASGSGPGPAAGYGVSPSLLQGLQVDQLA